MLNTWNYKAEYMMCCRMLDSRAYNMAGVLTYRCRALNVK